MMMMRTIIISMITTVIAIHENNHTNTGYTSTRRANMVMMRCPRSSNRIAKLMKRAHLAMSSSATGFGSLSAVRLSYVLKAFHSSRPATDIGADIQAIARDVMDDTNVQLAAE